MGKQASSALSESRVALAIEQLHMAIDLFLTDRSHASALTLAGAAEAILEQQAKRFRAMPILAKQYEVRAKLLSNSGHRVPSEKKFFKEQNTLRNQMKHFDGGNSEWIDGNVAQGAIQMLGRACGNYELCGLPPTETMKAFYAWNHGQIVEPPLDA